MPADYGRLSARDKARLRAAQRRAGLAKPPPKQKAKPPPRDTRTVTDVRTETKKREKTKRDYPTKRPVTSTAGRFLLRGEDSVVPGHMMADPKLNAMFRKAGLTGGPGIVEPVLRATGVSQLASDAKWAVTHPLERLTGEGRAADSRMEFVGFTKLAGMFRKAGLGKGLEPPPAVARPAEAEKIVTRDLHANTSQRLGRLADASGREIGPDEYVTLYHGTTPEGAAALRSGGFRQKNKPRTPPPVITDPTVAKMLGKNVGDRMDYAPGSGVGSGLYLSMNPSIAKDFGSVVVPVRVRVSELRRPPERRGRSDPIKALLVGDGYVRTPLSPGRFAGEVSPGTPPPGAAQIREALPEAKKLRRQQEAGYSAERGKRAAEAEAAMKRYGGREGYQAALAELKGELPKLRFGALENFDEPALKELLTYAQEHPGLRAFEKVRTNKALLKVVDGAVPTKSEIKLLDRVYGADVSTQIMESIPFWTKAKNTGLEVINIPRALKSSFDLSAPFRQGLVLGARHPKMFASEFKPMLKAFKSEDAYDDIIDEIASRPTFGKMQTGKVQLTDLENMATREEGFMSNFAEVVPGVRASGRAYTAFLTKFRADAFDNYLRLAEKQNLDIDDPAVLKSIGNWVNTATGRGSIKSLEGAMVPLNAMFFSPRLIASRLQLLNPAFYAKLDPFARKQALQGMTQLLGGVSLTLWMAKMAGAEVGMDSRSSDFAKIKVGDTRVDVAGGLQQYVVAATRFVKGESVSSTTGEVTTLEGGFAKPSRWSLAGDFLENKAAPVAGYGIDWAKNENFAGDKFEPLKELGRLHLPLGGENIYEGFKSSPAAGATSLLGSFGFGTQTYAADPEAKAEARKRKKGAAVNDHEKRMAALQADASANGATPPEDAVKASRSIREIDAAVHRARLKNGYKNKLPPQTKAQIAFRTYRKVFPENVATWNGLFADRTNDAARWQSYYEDLRAELYEPFSRLEISWDN